MVDLLRRVKRKKKGCAKGKRQPGPPATFQSDPEQQQPSLLTVQIIQGFIFLAVETRRQRQKKLKTKAMTSVC